MFNKAAPLYQKALEKSGYNHKLKYQPKEHKPPSKNRNRKRHIIWFNPPFNSTVKTNLAREFLSLIDRCFPPSNPLSKIFNRKTVKVSHSTTSNMAQIIASHNSKVLRGDIGKKKECNCPKTKSCPLDKKCKVENLIYQATVTKPNQEKMNYIGLSSTDFKARLSTHEQTFNDLSASQTSLSKYIWELKNQGILDYHISWKLIDRGQPFSPVRNVCQLCNKEKFYILFKPEMALLNSRNEIFNNCRHKKQALLIKKKRKTRKSPGS